MSASLELLCDFVEDPRKAADSIGARPPVGHGMLAYLLAGLSMYLAEAVSGRGHVLGLSAFSLAFVCLWRLAAGLGMSAVRHMLAEALGGKGSALPLFVLLGLSDLCWLLALPAAIILRAALPNGGRWWATGLFMATGYFALKFKARSVEHNYKINPANAWLTILLPYIGAVVFVVLLVLIGLAGTLSKAVNLFS